MNIPNFLSLYQFLNIPPWEILQYFLYNLGSAFILILSFICFLVCNIIFTLYHMYMMKDEENSSRLLNVFYGQYALTLQLSSFFLMMAVVFESFVDPIWTAEEKGDNFVCIVNRFRLLIVCMILVEQIEISVATLLRHWKPSIYLQTSLKWYPKIGFVFLVFISFGIFVLFISLFDNGNVMCSSFNAKKNMFKMISIVFILCGLIQFGVLVDSNWGWKTIKKRCLSSLGRFRNRVSPLAGNGGAGQVNVVNVPLPVMYQHANDDDASLMMIQVSSSIFGRGIHIFCYTSISI